MIHDRRSALGGDGVEHRGQLLAQDFLVLVGTGFLGLGDEGEGTEAEGADGDRGASMGHGADHDDLGLAQAGAQLLQRLQAVQHRHLHIQGDDVGVAGVELVDGFLAVGRQCDDAGGRKSLQRIHEDRAEGQRVVGYQDA